MRRLASLPSLNIPFFPTPQTFVVEEITPTCEVLEVGKKIEKSSSDGKFAHFVLQKSGWSTIQAELAIAKALHITHKRFSHAGIKDKNATTTQLCSVFAIEPEKLLSLKIQDIQINGSWACEEPVRMGELLGNRFTALIPQTSGKEEAIKEIASETRLLFPNYFGSQRFGSLRSNTHKIGKLLLQEKFKEAIMSYLSDSSNEKDPQAVQARKELAETHDFNLALKNFPSHLKYERLMLHHLTKYPNDFVGAVQRLPRALSIMFLHAYQSYLFNKALEVRVHTRDFVAREGEFYCGRGKLGFPDLSIKKDGSQNNSFLVCKLLGYETKESELTEIEKKLLEEEGITLSLFKIKKFPALSVKGAYRSALAPMVDFSFVRESGLFRFSLQKGAYGTVALQEFIGSGNH